MPPNESVSTIAADPILLDELERLPAEDIIRWAVSTFRRRIALSASFGGGGIVLAHMLSEIDATVPVLFLDTGFHFPETLAFKEAFARRHGLNVITLRPAALPAPLYAEDPDRCCAIHKVEPMRRALASGTYDAWISGLRRDQSATRNDIRVVENDQLPGRSLVRLHPLASWTVHDVKRYISAHELTYHPLLDQGYTSIGCWPCTRPTRPGEHERAGRWSGTAKTECGLHARAQNGAQRQT